MYDVPKQNLSGSDVEYITFIVGRVLTSTNKVAGGVVVPGRNVYVCFQHVVTFGYRFHFDMCCG